MTSVDTAPPATATERTSVFGASSGVAATQCSRSLGDDEVVLGVEEHDPARVGGQRDRRAGGRRDRGAPQPRLVRPGRGRRGLRPVQDAVGGGDAPATAGTAPSARCAAHAARRRPAAGAARRCRPPRRRADGGAGVQVQQRGVDRAVGEPRGRHPGLSVAVTVPAPDGATVGGTSAGRGREQQPAADDERGGESDQRSGPSHGAQPYEHRRRRRPSPEISGRCGTRRAIGDLDAREGRDLGGTSASLTRDSERSHHAAHANQAERARRRAGGGGDGRRRRRRRADRHQPRAGRGRGPVHLEERPDRRRRLRARHHLQPDRSRT